MHAAAVRAAMLGDVRPLVAALSRKVARLAEVERFEEAAAHRDRLAAFVRAAARMQRLSALTGCAELVAARPARRRRLGDRRGPPRPARGHRGRRPRPRIRGSSSAALVGDRRGRHARARVRHRRRRAEETECVLRWLEQPGVRLVSLTGTWACPAYGAGGVRLWAEAAEAGRDALDPFGSRRDIRPVHQPGALAAVSRIVG